MEKYKYFKRVGSNHTCLYVYLYKVDKQYKENWKKGINEGEVIHIALHFSGERYVHIENSSSTCCKGNIERCIEITQEEYSEYYDKAKSIS